MEYSIFLIILAFIVSAIVWFKREDGDLVCMTFIGIMMAGLIILAIQAKHINFNNVDSSLGLIITNTMSNEEITEELEKLIEYEGAGKISNISTTIEDNKVSNLTIKEVKVKVKEPIITKHLYTSMSKKFKIIIKDGEVDNNNIEIVGLRRKAD